MIRRLASLLLVGAFLPLGCGPEALDLPADPAETGVPVGVRTLEIDGLTVEVWYPASDRDADGTRAMVDLAEWIPDSFVERVGAFETPTLATRAIRDARVRRPETPYPVVLFSHGLGGFRSQSVDFTTHLASRGYVVLSADHPGRTLPDLIPCVFEPPPEECVLTGTFEDPAPAHLDTLLDWVQTESADSFLEDAVDATSIAVTGHSAGASSSVTVSETDVRPDALLLLAGGRAVTADSPTLAIGGTCDAIVDEARMQESLAGTTDGQLVKIVRSGHLAFSDICQLDLLGLADSLLEGRDDLNGFLWGLLRTLASDGCPGRLPDPPPADCSADDYLPLDTSARIIRHYSTVFLDATLRGDGETDVTADFTEVELY